MEIYNLISSGKQKNTIHHNIDHNINGSVSPLSFLNEVLWPLQTLHLQPTGTNLACI